MLFQRIDDNETNGRPRVRYQTQFQETSFEIIATFDGVKAVGETPVYTDNTGINNAFVKAYYQHCRIKATGKPISVREELDHHLYGITF